MFAARKRFGSSRRSEQTFGAPPGACSGRPTFGDFDGIL
jgi:hypothetical protein